MPHLLGVSFLSLSLIIAGVLQAQVPTHIHRSESRWTSDTIQVGAFDQNNIWKRIKPDVKLNQGWVYAVNDATSLYLLFDLVSDTGDDSSVSGGTANDAIKLIFDIDRDGQITAETDTSYFARAASEQFVKAISFGKGRKPRLAKTNAHVAAKFEVSPASNIPHRIWEISIPLAELSASPGGDVRLGFRLWSTNPPFDDSNPPGLEDDYSQLMQIHIAEASFVPAGMSASVDTSHAAPSTSTDVARTINADGKVEFRLSDGTRRILESCGWTDIFPDGRRSAVTCIETQEGSAPPVPTNPQNVNWLNAENESLLAIMKALVGNNQEAVQYYLNTEKPDWDVYERIRRRTRTIRQLLSR